MRRGQPSPPVAPGHRASDQRVFPASYPGGQRSAPRARMSTVTSCRFAVAPRTSSLPGLLRPRAAGAARCPVQPVVVVSLLEASTALRSSGAARGPGPGAEVSNNHMVGDRDISGLVLHHEQVLPCPVAAAAGRHPLDVVRVQPDRRLVGKTLESRRCATSRAGGIHLVPSGASPPDSVTVGCSREGSPGRSR